MISTLLDAQPLLTYDTQVILLKLYTTSLGMPQTNPFEWSAPLFQATLGFGNSSLTFSLAAIVFRVKKPPPHPTPIPTISN